jgi:hypothetical protein
MDLLENNIVYKMEYIDALKNYPIIVIVSFFNPKNPTQNPISLSNSALCTYPVPVSVPDVSVILGPGHHWRGLSNGCAVETYVLPLVSVVVFGAERKPWLCW